MRSLSTALAAGALVGCVSTTLEVVRNDPAHPDAPGAPPAESSRALAAGFDPFEGEDTSAAGAGHEGHTGHGSSTRPDAAAASAGAAWSCSMHPEIQRSGPGNCPICGMRLIEKPRDGGTPDHAGHGGKP